MSRPLENAAKQPPQDMSSDLRSSDDYRAKFDEEPEWKVVGDRIKRRASFEGWLVETLNIQQERLKTYSAMAETHIAELYDQIRECNEDFERQVKQNEELQEQLQATRAVLDPAPVPD